MNGEEEEEEEDERGVGGAENETTRARATGAAEAPHEDCQTPASDANDPRPPPAAAVLLHEQRIDGAAATEVADDAPTPSPAPPRRAAAAAAILNQSINPLLPVAQIFSCAPSRFFGSALDLSCVLEIPLSLACTTRSLTAAQIWEHAEERVSRVYWLEFSLCNPG